jgi:phosphoribosyl-AMP cyclohydrolase
MTLTFDAPSSDKAELESGPAFTPRFDEKGLITAVVTDARDGELLMVAHMNAEALALTLETGVAHYYSRSRKSLWKKGESSGAGHDATCHTGRRSCFYRTVGMKDGKAVVTITDDHRHFDPAEIYDKN